MLYRRQGCILRLPCGNGTDALMLALLALNLKRGDEVIVPAFTFVAPAEAASLLGITPVFADVLPDTFCIDPESIIRNITPKTKAIIPVHLFGQCADMNTIMEIAEKYGLFIIEDTAQALGCDHKDCNTPNNYTHKAGTIGHIGCTSFFPSKNLGCYGDGGALFTNDYNLAERIYITAHHGSEKKYFHKEVGINSRLDTIQAAVLNAKLPHLDSWNKARKDVAKKYNSQLLKIKKIVCPQILPYKTHIFHQYTLTLQNAKMRNELREFLTANGIATAIYYPVPLNEQEAYRKISKCADGCPTTKKICDSVLSLPICPELTDEKIIYITDTIKRFFHTT